VPTLSAGTRSAFPGGRNVINHKTAPDGCEPDPNRHGEDRHGEADMYLPAKEQTSYTRTRGPGTNVPIVSGDDCVRALVDTGWSPVERTDRIWRLERGEEMLIVPRDPVLDLHWLLSLLDTARVLPSEFVAALQRSTR
jgi:hypothetical protein